MSPVYEWALDEWEYFVPHNMVNECPWTSTTLMLLGALVVARLAFKTLYVLAQTFVLPGTSLKKFGATKGSWAVVTGASDGIGREFSLQLAAAGFNILLVARNRDSLATLAEEIGTKYGPTVNAKVQLIDFSMNHEAAYQSLAAVCAPLDIGVLVNNVGRSHEMPTDYVDTTQSEIDDILTINIHATLRMTSMVLPGMINRKRGLILNMGSFAGSIPSPMLATYSGSKAFLSAYSSSLAAEAKPHNIIVEHVNAFYVVSKMSKLRKPSPLVPLPNTYVRSVLSKVGLACGAAFSDRPGTCTPFWSHALADYAMTLVGWKVLFIGYTHSIHRTIRKRALRKKEREAKKQ